jgi:hypothetical protein
MSEQEIDQIGVCQAIIAGISTKVDGSIIIKLEVNPSEQEIIAKLMNKWSLNQRLLNVGLVSITQ